MTATHTHPLISSIVEQTARRWWVHLPRGFAATGYRRHRRLRLSGQGSGRRHHALRALSSEKLYRIQGIRHARSTFSLRTLKLVMSADPLARQRGCLVLTACKAVARVPAPATGLHCSPSPRCLDRIGAWPLPVAAKRRILPSRGHFLTANTQTTPPCGTLFSRPGILPSVANASWIRCASTPQPDWTAIYCVPSTS